MSCLLFFIVKKKGPNHNWGILCHHPSLPLSLCPSSFCDVCDLCGGAVVCSPAQEEHGRLRTLLCGLGKTGTKTDARLFLLIRATIIIKPQILHEQH